MEDSLRSNEKMNIEIDENFIGVFDNAFSDGLCERYIEYYKDLEKNNLIYDRQQYRHQIFKKHQIDDNSYDTVTANFFYETKINYISHEFSSVFWENIYRPYSEKFSILQDFDAHQIFDVKLQKTFPGQGYHLWHSEVSGRLNSNRLLAFSMFLNTVEEGGETEFLYLKKRFSPIKNRMLLWPAGFTHTHRGNPPISGDKYIITGWVEF